MSTYKRRIVYLSDEEWAGLAGLAKERGRGTTISSLIRDAISFTEAEELPATKVVLQYGKKPSVQAQRDDLLRKINRR